MIGQGVIVFMATCLSFTIICHRSSDVWRLIGFALEVNWGHRQLTLVWRMRSILPGDNTWGEIPRSGFKMVGAE